MSRVSLFERCFRHQHFVIRSPGFESSPGFPAFEGAESNTKFGDFPLQPEALGFSSQSLVLGQFPGLAPQYVDKLSDKQSNDRLLVAETMSGGDVLGRPRVRQQTKRAFPLSGD